MSRKIEKFWGIFIKIYTYTALGIMIYIFTKLYLDYRNDLLLEKLYQYLKLIYHSC